MSTRRKPPSRRPSGVRSTGLKLQARHRYGQPMPTPALGEHLWTILGVWRITDPAVSRDPAGEMHLDLENLLTLEGPGCFVCEQAWSLDVAAAPCPGDPGQAGWTRRAR